jgi:hypothetical protein
MTDSLGIGARNYPVTQYRTKNSIKKENIESCGPHTNAPRPRAVPNDSCRDGVGGKRGMGTAHLWAQALTLEGISEEKGWGQTTLHTGKKN